MKKEPLYRKENTRTRNVHHHFGFDAKYDRHTKSGISRKMKQGVQRGLDYTPLFKFLLSKVGKPWTDVHSEAVSRLDKEEPIFYMVKTDAKYDYFNWENSKFSVLIVDENGLLQKKNPDLKNEDFHPTCKCCTHTFNGIVLNNKFNPDKIYEKSEIKT